MCGAAIVTSRIPDRVDRRTLVVSVVVTLLVAVVVNGVLATFGLNRSPAEKWPSFAPPGHSIGVVWIVLFAAMGAARAFALGASDRFGKADARAIAGLIVLCLAYPFYTHVISGHATELAGNGITLVYALWLCARLRHRSTVATVLVGSVAVWIAFATVLVFALVQLNGWAT